MQLIADRLQNAVGRLFMFRKSFRRNSYNSGGRFQSRGSSFGRPQHRGQSIAQHKYVNKAAIQVVVETVIQHNFMDFPLESQLQTNIVSRGYVKPTPIQDQAIPHILEGRDVVGIANTGTGKTGAFLIPIIQKILKNRQERVLIIAPTRELAMQINDEFNLLARSLQMRSLLAIGGVSIDRQVSALKQMPTFLIGTPGRLKDLLQRRVLQLGLFKTIVLDEVDRMVDIGFINDIKFIISFLSKERQSLFFSATVTSEISSIMQVFLQNPITVSVKKTETAQSIDQDVIRVTNKEEKLVKLIGFLRTPEFNKVLVFGRTKWSVEKLSKSLQQQGFRASSIHGNKSQNQRLRALTEFKQNRIQVLVATDIAARGLDISDVSHVINFDEPGSYTDYVHRIGRTGRADKQGKALTFVM